MHSIVFLDRATIAPQIVLRRPDFPHQWRDYDRTRPEEVVERLKGATICINNKVVLSRAILEQLPDLKLIAMAATGSDAVDKVCCRERGIAVANIRGYALHTLPEHTFALMLALRRSIIAYRDDVKRGEWQKSGQFCFFNHPIRDMHGSRLGIIGEGVLGQAVANLARAFGMTVMFAAHKGVQGLGPLYTPFEEVLETSDIITLHCPLTPATKGLLGMAEFRRMKRRPLIINTARGGLIVDEDLAQALKEGLIGGAAIDVTTPEPPPADSILMALTERPDFILTPHIAWASDEAQQTLADQLIDNIENFAKGEPTNLVLGDF